MDGWINGLGLGLGWGRERMIIEAPVLLHSAAEAEKGNADEDDGADDEPCEAMLDVALKICGSQSMSIVPCHFISHVFKLSFFYFNLCSILSWWFTFSSKSF